MNIRLLFNRFIPPACLLCGSTTRMSICAGCLTDLPWHDVPQCPVCATPTPRGEVCGRCLKHPPAYDHTLAALTYRFPLDRLIPRLKYQARLAVAPALADSLARTVADAPRPDRVIPMPLHPTRLRERGFNHAGEIARDVADALALPLDIESCQRIRDTPPQQALKLDARRRNVRNAFICREILRDEHVAIVDDVMTSGASLDELAATLKRAGARKVSNWVVTRALPPGE